MMHPIPMSGGDEHDALTPWRRVLIWRAGDRSSIKRRYRRRVRRMEVPSIEDYDWPSPAELRLIEYELNGCALKSDQPFY